MASTQSQLPLDNPYMYFGVWGFYLFPTFTENEFEGLNDFQKKREEMLAYAAMFILEVPIKYFLNFQVVGLFV